MAIDRGKVEEQREHEDLCDEEKWMAFAIRQRAVPSWNQAMAHPFFRSTFSSTLPRKAATDIAACTEMSTSA